MGGRVFIISFAYFTISENYILNLPKTAPKKNLKKKLGKYFLGCKLLTDIIRKFRLLFLSAILKIFGFNFTVYKITRSKEFVRALKSALENFGKNFTMSKCQKSEYQTHYTG